MFYLKAFVYSLYNISWLRSQKNNGKKAANYVVIFIVALSLIYSGYSTYVFLPQLREGSDGVFSQVPEFHAELKDGQLSVRDLEQSFVYESNKDGEHFKVIVDTVNTSTLNLNESSGDNLYTILITRDAMSVHEKGTGKTTTNNFKGTEDTTFAKEDLENVVNSFLHNSWLIFALLLVFWFIAFTIGRVVYGLLLSLLVFLAAKFFKPGKWKFSEIYTVHLFALTLPSIALAFLSLFGLHIPYLFSVLILVILSVVVFLGDGFSDGSIVTAQDNDQNI